MKTEKTITICGKEVKLLYCAATENGYEQLAGQSINDLDFRKQSDLLKLALAAIISAYIITLLDIIHLNKTMSP